MVDAFVKVLKGCLAITLVGFLSLVCVATLAVRGCNNAREAARIREDEREQRELIANHEAQPKPLVVKAPSDIDKAVEPKVETQAPGADLAPIADTFSFVGKALAEPGAGRGVATAEEKSPLSLLNEEPVDYHSRHAQTLLKSAENLAADGKTDGAIAFFRQAVIEHPNSYEASEALDRLADLGGKVPSVAEYRPREEPKPEIYAKRPRSGPPRYYDPETALYEVQNPPQDEPSYSIGSSTRSRRGADSAEKTVHVRSYTRSNGTHVQSHMRRSPRR